MAYNTGNFPPLSTGNFHPSHFSYKVDTSRMTNREHEVARIKARMKELGYNQNSLSVKLFGTKDRVRDYLRNKSEHMRGDTYKALMDELWPEESDDFEIRQLKEREIGLTKTVEMLLEALLKRNILPKNDLEVLFNHELRELRVRGQKPIAASVLDQFLDFLHSKSFVIPSVDHGQSQQPQPGQPAKKNT